MTKRIIPASHQWKRLKYLDRGAINKPLSAIIERIGVRPDVVVRRAIPQYHETEGKTIIAAKSQRSQRFAKFQRHFCQTRNKSGAAITTLVGLVKIDKEIVIAARKNALDLPSLIQRRKKYKPISARLSDGTSGMNERPAKTFPGAKA